MKRVTEFPVNSSFEQIKLPLPVPVATTQPVGHGLYDVREMLTHALEELADPTYDDHVERAITLIEEVIEALRG